jgi:hypothetical protein
MKTKFVSLIISAGIFLSACSSNSAPNSTEPVSEPSASESATEIVSVGAISFDSIVDKFMTPEIAGVQKGLPVADATAVMLDENKVRIYFFAQEKGILSAISSVSDFSKWEIESKITSKAWGQPRAVKLDDGSIRLFFTSGGIKSAISKDGLNFEEESGYRISKSDVGFEPGAMSIVKLGDTYFGYFSELEKPGAPISKNGFYVAKSSNLLDWEFIGPVTGASSDSALKGNGKHPFALLNDLGGVTLYGQGDRNKGSGVIASVSKDGINFTDEYLAFEIPGAIPADPDIFKINNDLYMIYGGFDPSLGGYLSLAKSNTNQPNKSESTEFQQPGEGNQNPQPADMNNLPPCKPGEPPDPSFPCKPSPK